MIEIKDIIKSYTNENVLKGISLKIDDGEFVSITGRSGSGKTTLLNVIAGFLAPNSGTVLFNNQNIYSLSDKQLSYLRCNEIGFVFQQFKLINTLTVKDNIYLPASLSQKSKSLIDANYNKYIEKLNIKELVNKYPDELSGGQAQRVAIARALCYSPSVLILDEPTSALDSESEKYVLEIIQEFNNEKKGTIIMVTHSKYVASFSKREIALTDGIIK